MISMLSTTGSAFMTARVRWKSLVGFRSPNATLATMISANATGRTFAPLRCEVKIRFAVDLRKLLDIDVSEGNRPSEQGRSLTCGTYRERRKSKIDCCSSADRRLNRLTTPLASDAGYFGDASE